MQVRRPCRARGGIIALFDDVEQYANREKCDRGHVNLPKVKVDASTSLKEDTIVASRAEAKANVGKKVQVPIL